MKSKILILKSGRCAWGRCMFCGYGRIYGPASERLKDRFDDFFEEIKDEDRGDRGDSEDREDREYIEGRGEIEEIKIFGSGSFLDENQVPSQTRRYFVEKCKTRGIERVVIESRPEFVTKERLEDFKDIEFTVAIGLEVADDVVLDKIQKGFHMSDFEKAVRIIKECGGKVRTYLLVNLPFVDDIQESLDKSVEYALKYSDSVILINLLPHADAALFKLWMNGEWNFLDEKQFFSITQKWEDNPKIELDLETFKFIPKFPSRLRQQLIGVGEEYLTHPHFEVWQDYLCRWYEPKGRILLFLPCSYKKPYSRSKTHRGIIKELKRSRNYDEIHQVMISNAGVIPREFEAYYPFSTYDWDETLETKEIKQRFIEVTTQRIESYLKAHHCEKILCFLKYDSESYKALEMACDKLGIKFKNLLRKETYEEIKSKSRPLQTKEALTDLYEELKLSVRS